MTIEMRIIRLVFVVLILQPVAAAAARMKLVHKNFEKDGVGSITLVPEETEDMWHAFNLIAEGDSVRSSTIRKVMNAHA